MKFFYNDPSLIFFPNVGKDKYMYSYKHRVHARREKNQESVGMCHHTYYLPLKYLQLKVFNFSSTLSPYIRVE